MVTVTAVVCSHANPDGLRHILGSLRYQTRPPDETLVYCSDTPDLLRLREDFPEAQFHERPNLDDWGHEKRAEGLDRATSEWVGFFNDDDSYHVSYLERMLAVAAATGGGQTAAADVVYCGWNTYPACTFTYGSSTSGNFLVRTRFAQKVGYPTRRYEADGDFIEMLNNAGAVKYKLEDTIYFHNSQ
jgi:glycosyl transferase family 2